MSKAKVLVIDDDPEMLDLARFHLEKNGYDVACAETGAQGLRLVAEHHHEVTLTDLKLPDIYGIELVAKLKESSPATEVIMITGYGAVTEAIEATKAGAFYFMEKPVEFEELMALIERAIERGRQVVEIEQLRGRLRERASYYNIIGSSRPMQNIYEIIESIAESDANVMILGESGTGKELIANAIHFKSARSKKPFVKINCSALPKELIESELFGHTKGAFTGATMEKMGLIGQAAGGSLLLDEIAEMPVELQPKLLRVLQERVYYRVGSEKALDADFRLISATNRNPLDAIREGSLREDLYYRINTIEIQVPPLRERAEDVQHLAEHFLRIYAEKYNRSVRSISQLAYERMFTYSWPGNVRELQNVMERAVLLAKGDIIEESAIPMPKPTARAAQAATAATVATIGRPAIQPGAVGAVGAVGAGPAPPAQLSELTMEQLARLIVNKMPTPKSGASRVDIFTQLEGAIVRAALERTRGNKQAAANLLGLYRPRLYSMLRKHNLHDTIRESEQNTPETDVAEDDLIESEALNQDPEPDLAEQGFARSGGADPEPPKEPPKDPSKELPGEDIVGTPNISGPDASEFHFRKGVPYQY
ncbi:MAG TPA: sigma-54 dependent transcriptional regulator [Blastocatellia bacterium]|nr:sigma-54 dependent transcriptional regulator [Blastocatellia bacterium]